MSDAVDIGFGDYDESDATPRLQGRPAHEPTYGSTGPGRRAGPGHEPGLSHAQFQHQQVAGHAPAPRLGRNVSSEKIATPRNPTILRKSKSVLDVENMDMLCANAPVTRAGRVCLPDVRGGGADGGGGGR